MNEQEMRRRLIDLGEIPVYPDPWPDVDILISHYGYGRKDRDFVVKLCMKAALDTDYPGKKRLIIAICGTTPDMEEFIRSLGTDDFPVKIIRVQNSIGYAKTRLIEEAEAGIVGLLDDDALVRSTWMREGVGRVREGIIVGLSSRRNKIAPFGGGWVMHKSTAVRVGLFRYDFKKPIGPIFRLGPLRMDSEKEFAMRAMEKGCRFLRTPKGHSQIMHVWEGRKKRNHEFCKGCCESFLGKKIEEYGL